MIYVYSVVYSLDWLISEKHMCIEISLETQKIKLHRTLMIAYIRTNGIAWSRFTDPFTNILLHWFINILAVCSWTCTSDLDSPWVMLNKYVLWFHVVIKSEWETTLIVRFEGPTMRPIWGRQDPGGPHVAPWTLLSGKRLFFWFIHLKT